MKKKNNGEHLNKSRFGTIEYMALVLCVLAGAVMIAVMFFGDNEEKVELSSDEDNYDLIDLFPSEEKEVSELSEIEEASQDAMPYITVEIDSESVYMGDLILVNKENHYTFKDTTEIIDVYEKKVSEYKLGSGEEKLYEKTILAANSFLGDFYNVSGLTNVALVNGFISMEEQQKKYENYIKSTTPEDAQKWGVKAGASDHHTGLSFNLMLYPANGKIGEGDYAWIIENAYRYGFILRYPEDKTDITSVKDNNHFRYVGIPHAEYIYKNNLVLEEYISMLEKTTYTSPLRFQSGSKEYIIYYSPADSTSLITEVKIPEGYAYTYSGDNISGFIITASLPN